MIDMGRYSISSGQGIFRIGHIAALHATDVFVYYGRDERGIWIGVSFHSGSGGWAFVGSFLDTALHSFCAWNWSWNWK